MDYKYIEQLLDRYFDAETTLQEEQILHTFFCQPHDDMPESVARYAELFAAMEPQASLSDDFDERLLALTGENAGVRVVKAHVVTLRERLRPLFSAAAMVAILLTLGNAISQSMQDSDTLVDTEEYAGYHVTKSGDPAMAYDQKPLSDSLSVVGDLLNQGQPVDTLRVLGLD